jgi:cytochrome c553
LRHTLRGAVGWLRLGATFVAICGAAWCATTGAVDAETQAAAPFENTLAQRVQACTTCHGPQGRAGPDAYYPRLAGKPAHYLYKQLLDFRDGRRHYPLMTGLLAPLRDDYLFEIAQHFSALDVPHAPPSGPTQPNRPSGATAQQLARGQRLAQDGDVSRKLPACAACHGAALMGVAPDVPGLLGLSPDYINAQLGGWRLGQRLGTRPDCMALVAKRLNPDDIAAVSAWLASKRVVGVGAAIKPAAGVAPEVSASLARDHADLACAKASPPGQGTAAAAPEGSTVASSVASPVVVRGAYLAQAGHCAGCHTTLGANAYAGGRAIETPFGKVYASNLTPDKTHGLGDWSRDDFWQALHHGRSKDGRLLYPAFPYTNYTRVSREDSDALFAFFQSLPPKALSTPAHELRWPFSSQWALRVWRALYFKPGTYQAAVDKSAEWNRGAYLVQGLGHCNACHAPRNALGASTGGGALAGGLIPMQNWYAPALTSVHEAGVANWAIDDIVALLKTGQSTQASVSGPMAEVVRGSTQHLNLADLQAMAIYLKALQAAPAQAKQAAPNVPTNASNPRGAKIYEQHCAQCHGEQGQGVAGAYPALAGNRAVSLPTAVNLVQVVLQGGFAPATGGNPRPYGMPPYLLTLSDSDVATVLSHIRGSWGNNASAVTELEVNQIRNQTAR